MDVRWFLFFLLLTVTCSDLLQAQPQEGGSEGTSRSEVDELKNITLTLLKEFLSFSASVKADLTALKLNFASLQSELGQVADTVTTNKRKIKAQGAILDGFQSQLDSIQHAVERGIMNQGEQLFNQTSALVSQLADHQLDSMQAVERNIIGQGERLFNQTSEVSALVIQLAGQQMKSIQLVERDILDQGKQLFNQTSALVHQLTDQQLDRLQVVERDILDQGEQLFNQTSAVSALVGQLADQQDALYHNLSNEVSSVCSVERNNLPTQAYTTEPPASMEFPTSTAVSPSSTTGLPTSTPTSPAASSTGVTVSPTAATGSPTSTSVSPSPTIEGYSCGGTSGWRRVAFLNMTDPTHQCPSGWQLTDYSKRTCGRASTSRRTCDSAAFPTGEQSYSRVCGRIVAYQFGSISAFHSSSRNIESSYVTGVSVTHGSPRQHIWTFAGGLAESGRYISESCPCDGGTRPVPDFVGSDYYCESGINGPWISRQWVFHPEDRLWDGEDCGPTSSCCEGTALPYFVKELGGSTTDDIETRICSVHSGQYSNIAIELVEFYVQ